MNSRRKIDFYEILLVLIIIFNLVDISVTSTVVSLGLAYEVNPFMEVALDWGIPYFIIIKLSIIFGGCYLLWKRRDKTFARAGIVTCFLVYLSLMIHFIIFFSKI